MTFTSTPFAQQNVPINADVVRQAVSSLVPNGGGLVQSGDLAVTALATPGMSVQVAAGRVWIDGTTVAHLSGQGYGKQAQYFGLNDAPVTLTIAPADTTNPRIDVVYVAVQDSAYAGTTDGGGPAVVTGVAAATPQAPSIPSNAIALANVSVGVNASSITNSNITAQPVPVIGRPLLAVSSAAARNAIANPTAGMEIIRTDVDNYRQRYDGSQWHFIGQPTRIYAGSYTNPTGTGSRLLGTISNVKNYATNVSAYGRATVFCPSITSGVEEINVAVSVAQSGVATAQGKARLVWSAGLSNCNLTQSAECQNINVPAGNDAFIRLWVEVITGGVSTTVSGSPYTDLYADVMPADD